MCPSGPSSPKDSDVASKNQPGKQANENKVKYSPPSKNKPQTFGDFS